MANIKADSAKQTKRINFRLTGLEYEKLSQSVRRLVDFEPSKLLFWKKPKKPRW